MHVIVLQSGSNGNCTYVEAGDVRLLFDAGISGSQVQQRLAAFGRDVSEVDALLISHDHSDHIRSMGVYQRKFGLPIHVTRPTYEAACSRRRLGVLDDVRCFAAGGTVMFGGVRVETIPTAHDGVDGVGFVVDDGRRRFGILTDLGHVFSGLRDVLQSLDAVLLESNYEPRMLEEGPYPEFLKERIRGPAGHLSNGEAAQLLASSLPGRIKWICLGHLSEQNNQPELALNAHRRRLGDRVPLHVASRHAARGEFEV